jgi:hypothetical protein
MLINGKEIMNQMPSDGTINFNVDPQALWLGFPDMNYRTKCVYMVLSCLNYAEPVYTKGKVSGYRRRGYANVSKSNMAKYLGLSRAEMNKTLKELEDAELIVQERIKDDRDMDLYTRVHFNFTPFIVAANDINNMLETCEIPHRLNADQGSQRCEDKTSPGFNQIERRGPIKEDSNNKSTNNKVINYVDVTTLQPEPALQGAGVPSSLGNNSPDSSNSSIVDTGAIGEGVEPLDSFVIGDTQPKDESAKKTKLKGVFKKIEAGEIGKITANDLLDYFSDRYLKKYRSYFTIPVKDRPKTLAMITNGPLAKYGTERCLELIRQLVDLYEEVNPDKSTFPKPHIRLLNADWFLSLLNNHLENKTKVADVAKAREAAAKIEDIKGPYSPFSVSTLSPVTKLKILNEVKSPYFQALATKGYLPIEILGLDTSEITKYIKEVAIPAWNETNDYQMIP